MSLVNKTIIITGGSCGIGKAVVELLSAKGANVVFTYLKNEADAKKIVASCRGNAGHIQSYGVDVKDYGDVKELINKVIREYKHIDVIVNNAGIKKDKSLLYMEPSDWDDVMNTNLTGVFNVVKSAMPYLLKQRKGRIINMGSVSGISGLAGQTNYSSSKAGIIGFTKALAKEVATYNICVNTIAPGPVETKMLKDLSKEHLEKLLKSIPMKRMCTPREVAMTVNFLADEELSPPYLTGQVITLDGGGGI